MSKIVVVGAGKTGRGFIGRLLAENDNEIVFIDTNKELVDSLNAEKSFEIFFFGDKKDAVTVNNYTAYTWENAEISDVTTIFVSVGGGNLKAVGASLRELLNPEKQYSIITCENAVNPAKTLKEACSDKENFGFSEAAVFCTTIEESGLNIMSEDYPYLPCDKLPLKPNFSKIPAIRPTEGFENFLIRKIFTYNSASAIIAYLGWLKNYTIYSEAANDPEILALLDENYVEINAALCKKYGYDEADQTEFAALSKKKFCDAAIVDTIERNAREPHRKLGKAERVIGPMLLIFENGGNSRILEKTAAAMLMYENENDTEWMKIKGENTYPQILEKICGLVPKSELTKRILEHTLIKKEGQND